MPPPQQQARQRRPRARCGRGRAGFLAAVDPRIFIQLQGTLAN